MLIGSWRANSLFVLRPRAVYFLSFGLPLNYRFVFSRTSPFQKAGALRRPRLLKPEPNPETRRPSKGRGPKTSTDLAETEQGRRTAHRCTARVSQENTAEIPNNGFVQSQENSFKICCKPSKDRKMDTLNTWIDISPKSETITACVFVNALF